MEGWLKGRWDMPERLVGSEWLPGALPSPARLGWCTAAATPSGKSLLSQKEAQWDPQTVQRCK